MDSLAGLLDGPRARGAFVLRSVLDPPWSLRIADEAPLTVVALVNGDAWLLPDGLGPTGLAAGDVVLIRGPDHYTVADDARTAPQVRIGPGQVCTDLTGADLGEQMSLGVRTWGTSSTGSTVLLTGSYQPGEVGRRLLDALPQVAVMTPSDWDSPVVDLLGLEVGRDGPGQSAVLDRLLDLLLVSFLRAWFDRPSSAAPGWYAAQGDPVVGPALRLMEHNPQQPWTVGTLAAAVGASRAAFARRFAEQVGESPIAFLTTWRLALAADLLAGGDATVARVAGQVGYGSPFTFSTAFKRHYGVSPQEYRARGAVSA